MVLPLAESSPFVAKLAVKNLSMAWRLYPMASAISSWVWQESQRSKIRLSRRSRSAASRRGCLNGLPCPLLAVARGGSVQKDQECGGASPPTRASPSRSRRRRGGEGGSKLDATSEQAFLLLKKWRDERRLLQGSLFFSETTNACIVGRIEALTPSSVRIDAQSVSRRFGANAGLLLNLAEVIRFEFEDSRALPTGEDMAQFRQNYEGFLLMTFPGFSAQILAVRTDDEIDGSQI
jgi:hypothetical protein